MVAFVLLGKNIAITLVAVAVCTIAGWVCGVMIAGAAEPEAAQYSMKGGSIETIKIDHYYAMRNACVEFGAVGGLLVGQTTFLAIQLSPRKPESP
jgi:hypothetical protein